MSRITHLKLVRDRIAEIIEASGKTCVTRTLDDAAYLAALDQKLTEELAEYQQATSAGELADLLEVMMAVAEARRGVHRLGTLPGRLAPALSSNRPVFPRRR